MRRRSIKILKNLMGKLLTESCKVQQCQEYCTTIDTFCLGGVRWWVIDQEAEVHLGLNGG